MVRIGLLAAGLALGVGCALKDVRPDSLVQGTGDADRGRAVLHDMAQAHGIAQWRLASEIRVDVVDTWPNGLMRRFGTPLPQETTRVAATFVPGSGFDHSFVMQDGRRPGDGVISEGETVFRLRDGERKEKRGLKYSVYTAATQYLWELPFRLFEEAETQVWAGEQERDGRVVDVVLATWGGLEPSKDIDQYVLYVDQSTHLLVQADYTVRAGGRMFASTISFSDHRQVNGVVLAFEEVVDQVAPFAMRPLHYSQISSAEVDVPVAQR